MSRESRVGFEAAVVLLQRTVKEQAINPVVIVEIFDVSEAVDGAADVGVQLRGAVGGERHLEGIAQDGDFEEAGVSAAAGGVGLQAIDRAGGEHSAEIFGGVAIFAGGDVHAGWAAVAHQAQAFQIIRGAGFFEPGDVEFIGEELRHRQGLFAGVAAVGIDEEFGAVADGFSSGSNAIDVGFGIAADFHLDAGNSFGGPSAELLSQPFVGVAGESAAAVDVDGIADWAEEINQRDAQEFGFEIPESDIDRGHRHHSRARPTGVAKLMVHLLPDAFD